MDNWTFCENGASFLAAYFVPIRKNHPLKQPSVTYFHSLIINNKGKRNVIREKTPIFAKYYTSCSCKR